VNREIGKVVAEKERTNCETELQNLRMDNLGRVLVLRNQLYLLYTTFTQIQHRRKAKRICVPTQMRRVLERPTDARERLTASPTDCGTSQRVTSGCQVNVYWWR
jgi:hypothetical protein